MSGLLRRVRGGQPPLKPSLWSRNGGPPVKESVSARLSQLAHQVSIQPRGWQGLSGSWAPAAAFLSLLGGGGAAWLGPSPAMRGGKVFASAPAPGRFAVGLRRWRLDGPWADVWPDVRQASYGSMSRIDRYRTMRILEHSLILEPSRKIDAIAAYAEGRDERTDWSGLDSPNEAPTSPASRLRNDCADLVASARAGLAVEPRIARLLDGWDDASSYSSSTKMLWSLAHQRIVDAIVFSLAVASHDPEDRNDGARS